MYVLPETPRSPVIRDTAEIRRSHAVPEYLKQEHAAQYSSLILTGKSWTYLADLNADKRNSLFTVRTADGNVFEIMCPQAAGKEDGWTTLSK
ncbi:TnpV protein [Acetatifactor aquisgranensis]|uniref:TnpV protein n=1 Tax=Acetatifactor aquisgranensis TaxID=2941233 RepID=UPI00203F9886|nr:TnpV protein [Acetatifactor aquisgranensis]